MNKRTFAAAVWSLTVPGAALAGGLEAPAPSGPPALPPAVLSQISLGEAGLLSSFYSGSQYGITRVRRGEDNTRLGFSGASGITMGFEHSSSQLVASFTGRYLLPGGSSYLTLSFGTNNKREEPNLTEFDTSIPSFTIGYQNFASPDFAYAAYLSYADRETSDGVVTTSREEIGLRFDIAARLSDDWGVTSRLIYTQGDLVVTNPGGTTVSPETMLYGQVELVGNFTSETLGFVPEGWALQPQFGVSYDLNTVELPTGDDDRTSGSVWAEATLLRPAPPGSWSPNFTLGIEHVYENSTAAFIDDDTFAILGAGALLMQTNGNTFNVGFERRQGFNGNRVNNVFVAGYTANF